MDFHIIMRKIWLRALERLLAKFAVHGTRDRVDNTRMMGIDINRKVSFRTIMVEEEV